MASIIDPESAKSLIKEYRQQNASAGGPAINTPDGQNLNGFFLDRESLESILSNPKVSGVSLHLAKHPDFKGSADNKFTMIYAGAEPTEPGAATPLINTGNFFGGDTPLCPPWCPAV